MNYNKTILEKASDTYGGKSGMFNLLLQNPHCYFCGRKVEKILVPDHQQSLAHQATIDHLKSRFHRKKHEVVGKVLACYACNAQRSFEENLAHSTKEV